MQLIHPSVRVQTVGVTVGSDGVIETVWSDGVTETVGSGCVKEAVGVKVKSDVTHSYGLLNPYGSGLHIVSSLQLCPLHLPRRTLKKQKIRRQIKIGSYHYVRYSKQAFKLQKCTSVLKQKKAQPRVRLLFVYIEFTYQR